MDFLSELFTFIFSFGLPAEGEADGFSPIIIFLRADSVVKSVILILAIMSLLSWSVIFERWLALRRLRQTGRTAEQRIWQSESLAQAFKSIPVEESLHPHILLFRVAMQARQDRDGVSPERLSRLLASMSQRLTAQMGRGLDLLATIGATAPFIGLFGTVWGIMNSFQGIAASGDTALAVIAPGIAEALFATALGLFAAIPAVIFYNRLSFMLNVYHGMLANFADQLWYALTGAPPQTRPAPKTSK